MTSVPPVLEGVNATDMAHLSMFIRIKDFIKATGFTESDIDSTVYKYMERAAEVNDMAEIATGQLLISAMENLKAKEVTGSEAASILAMAGTLFSKTVVSLYKDEDRDMSTYDKAVKSIADITGMSTTEVIDIYVQIALKSRVQGPHRWRPPLSMFAEAAASVAEATGVSHNESAILLAKFMSEPTIESAFHSSRSISELMAMATKDAILSCNNPRSYQRRIAKRRRDQKGKSWKTAGDADEYDIDKVLKELGDDVGNLAVSKKVDEKPKKGNGNKKNGKKKSSINLEHGQPNPMVQQQQPLSPPITSTEVDLTQDGSKNDSTCQVGYYSRGLTLVVVIQD